MIEAFTIILAYMVGSIPTGKVLATLFTDVDPTESGSGNIGATNMNRILGRRFGIGTLMGDLTKGWAMTSIALEVLPNPTFVGTVAFSTILGHCFSAYLDFRGGKGVATAAGTLLALHVGVALLLGVAWAVGFAVTRKASVPSLAAAVLLPMAVAWFAPDYLVWSGAVCVLLIVRHATNIQRLLRGTEL